MAITVDDTMDSGVDDVIITGVTSFDKSILSEDKNAVVVNDSTTIVSDPNIISDDGLP